MRSAFVSVTITTAALLLAEGQARAADPTTADCLSASDASLKFGNQHKLRAERSQLLVCAATACPADIRKECLRKVDQVNAEIPTIIFAVRDATGADLSAVKVTMDGEVLAERLEGTALSIDPGEHAFTFETPDHTRVTRKFLIQQTQKDRRESVTIGTPVGPQAPAPLAPPPQGAAVPPPSTTVAPPAGETGHEGRGLGTQKVLALVAGGLGIVGMGVGTAFGVIAMSKKNDAQSACPAQCATADGVSKWSDAGSAGNISTVGFIVGGVALAGAAVLWFSAPTSSETSAQVGIGLGGVQLRGTW